MEVIYKNNKTKEEKRFTSLEEEEKFIKDLFPIIFYNFMSKHKNEQLTASEGIKLFKEHYSQNWNECSEEWKIYYFKLENEEFNKIQNNTAKRNKKTKSVGNRRRFTLL